MNAGKKITVYISYNILHALCDYYGYYTTNHAEDGLTAALDRLAITSGSLVTTISNTPIC